MTEELSKPGIVDYTKKDELPTGPPMITQPQAALIKKLRTEQGIDDPKMTLMVEEMFNVYDPADLTKTQASYLIEKLLGKDKKPTEPAQTPTKQENAQNPPHKEAKVIETTQGTGIVLAQTRQELSAPENQIRGFLRPKYTVDEAVAAFKSFEEAKTKILDPKDIIRIGEGGRPTTDPKAKVHIKRGGWRKLARFFGLNTKITARQRVDTPDGHYIYIVTAHVENPQGETVELDGAATSKDPFFTKGGSKKADEENVLMKAETVALNRAISDMLGSGEVSAEEMEE
jgi:hypothetical protein